MRTAVGPPWEVNGSGLGLRKIDPILYLLALTGWIVKPNYDPNLGPNWYPHPILE